MEELLYYFLLLVKKSNNILPLRSFYGVYYQEINKVYDFSLSEKFIYNTEEGVIITELGEMELVVLRKKLGIKGSDRFIIPNRAVFKPAISPNQVYLPARKE